MPSEAPSSQSRVLLTSEKPPPKSQSLAAILHDANNKLTPIMVGLSCIGMKNELAEDQLRDMMTVAEETRDEISLLLKDAMRGACNSQQFVDAVRHLHGRLKVILGPIQNAESEDMELYKEIEQAVEEFDALIERGQQFVCEQSFYEKPMLGNISQFVSGIVLSYHRRHPQVHFSLTINEDCVTAFRPASIKRALENLLNNAVQSLPEGKGKVSVDLRTTSYGPEDKPFVEIEDGTYVSMEISDNGSGIPEEVMDSLPSAPISTKEGGSGIGLASVRDNMLDHDGYLFVESEEGRGTKVTALIPSMFPPPPRLPNIEGHGNGSCDNAA